MMRSLGLNPSDADIKVHVDVFIFILIFFLDVDCDCVRCPTILMLTLFFILMLMHKVGGTPRMHIKVLNWYWIQVEGTQWLEFRKCQFNFFLFRKKSSKSTRSF